jgi:SAM-dependent methyltransferase
VPVLPSVVERALFAIGLAPRPLVDIAAGAAFRAMQASLRLGVFERLARGPMTVDALARELGADAGALSDLLALLEAAGHLRRHGRAYENAQATARWLVRDANESIAEFTSIWTDVVLDEWNTLEESVRQGAPALHMHDWLAQRAKWPQFNAAMAEFARGAADKVATAVDLSGAQTLLDLGGSHGLYAIAFCRRYPSLRATVVDLPMALEGARANIAAAGLAERVILQPGDVTAGSLGSGYGAALLFQLIHYFDDAALAALLRTVHAALRPGGRIVILDQMTPSPPTPAARAFLRTLALQYRISLGGRLRAFREVWRILEAAGFTSVSRKRLLKIPGNELAIAERR